MSLHAHQYAAFFQVIDSPDAPGDFAFRMKVSLVIPLYKESARIAPGLSDLHSFFARLPIEIELVFVCEPGQMASLESALTATSAPKNVSTVILENPKHLGRGPSLQKGLDAATGDIAGPMSMDLSVPLAEIFAAVQEFLRDPEGTGIVIGNRRSLKRPRHGPRTPIKKFFDDVEHDKAKGLEVPDPTSPFWVIKKELWQQISSQVKLRRWYYTPTLLSRLRLAKAPIKSLDINCHDDPDTRFRWHHSVFG